MRHAIYLLLLTISIAITTGCSSVPKQSSPELVGYTETGVASYYAMKYQFRQTASGERFNQYAHTAAHKTLPFGTKVRVTNLANNKNVTVKINDRGPFIEGRIIDLSRASFGQIGNLESGIIQVKIEVIK
ncbi:septal ring lytic transglycosylase RlpA family protein [Aliidiomarina halalkaliphila]|uniref:Endolytic peptidoglycan transglycosylase RlpA n=1 Tax=Aliidiomarina halalkaliphila TaxID=2593535 RepID=A0A552X139_9GAMM|nr:septal ring lytic transglycosylase RlpA family protein [Aliidiomarina halalkaliphila]TRW48656.1 septal ring lytic transglycosylase RlpA family protein [Aliidiomarina halalkaliphila]